MEQRAAPPAREAFGVEPEPLRKRLLAREAAAPKGVVHTVAAVSGGLAVLLGGAMNGIPFGFLIAVLVLGVPTWALERHYRARRRREREQLLPPR
jgi:Flp pilus assembly protein TadB